MLSRNLVIASVAVVFLASTVSAAPVEDKEPEENDFEAEEGEEELSEEEEDDDDSKAQHMKGAGSQQATSAPKGSGLSPSPGSSVSGESPNGHKLNGATQTGQVSLSSMSTSSEGSSGSNGRDGYSRPSASSSHGSSNNGQEGSKSEIASPAGGTGAHDALASKVPGPDGAVHSISVVSSGQGSSGHISAGHVIGRPSAGQTSGASAAVSSEVQSQPSGSEVTVEHTEGYENGDSAHETSQIESPEIPETESNGNGHKHLMNGGETGFTGLDHFVPDTSQIQGTGGFDTIGTSPHLEITGTIDQSNHDFLVGLMGGMGEDFGPDAHTAGLDQMTLQVDSTAAGSSPGPPSSGSSVLDVPPDSAGAASPSADFGKNDFAHSIRGSDNGSPADTTDSSLISDTLKHPGHYFTDYTDGGVDNGADAPDTNGNGRHKPVVDIQKGTEHQFVAMETHHTAVGILDHTLSPYADTTGQDGVTGASAQTDLAGVAGELATDGHVQTDTTDRGHVGVTDGFPKHTADSVHATGAGFTDVSQTHSDVVQTDLQATGDPFAVSSQTDVMGTATAEPQGTHGGPSHPGATEQTQTAVSAGEQYHTSGQGPEGAENVELEDTC
ncbi:mucin-22 isoform X4 [Triplophysa rosa]|uniref:mucin-22 isoform X4 n=1 Tax=Triplophysa rosa TaxID=992332 RepID=UPI0025460461|nr:mucin-22 isoform X4 [Triplophysa rosa]